tara:strand:+ start:240 stop:569 length:330 start_codon:yes stop_codon:yes gene_type:complete
MSDPRKSLSRRERSIVDDVLQRGERGERALVITLLEDAINGCVKGDVEDSNWIFGVSRGGSGFDFSEILEYLELSEDDIKDMIREKFDTRGVPQIQGDIFHGFSNRKDW